jgi:hypothetical protein
MTLKLIVCPSGLKLLKVTIPLAPEVEKVQIQSALTPGAKLIVPALSDRSLPALVGVIVQTAAA